MCRTALQITYQHKDIKPDRQFKPQHTHNRLYPECQKWCCSFMNKSPCTHNKENLKAVTGSTAKTSPAFLILLLYILADVRHILFQVKSHKDISFYRRKPCTSHSQTVGNVSLSCTGSNPKIQINHFPSGLSFSTSELTLPINTHYFCVCCEIHFQCHIPISQVLAKRSSFKQVMLFLSFMPDFDTHKKLGTVRHIFKTIS